MHGQHGCGSAVYVGVEKVLIDRQHAPHLAPPGPVGGGVVLLD